MTVTFQDMQQIDNPMNGVCLSNLNEVISLFRSFNNRQSFLFELQDHNGFKLTVGYARDYGCVQYSPSNGLPPYMMAITEDVVDDGGYVEFLAGGTPTPIPQRFCLPIDRIKNIVCDFLLHGGMSGIVDWEEI